MFDNTREPGLGAGRHLKVARKPFRSIGRRLSRRRAYSLDFRVNIFAGGADKATMLELYAKPWISGFTTNPTLMRKAGLRDYEAFARDILAAKPDRPISLEVFAGDFSEMERQARMIAAGQTTCTSKFP